MNHNPKEIVAALKRAQAAFLKQQYREALQDYMVVYDALGDQDPNIFPVMIEIGWTHYFLQEYDQAAFFMENAVREGHFPPAEVFDALRLIGFSYGSLGNGDRAIAFLQDALAQPVEEFQKRQVYFELGKLFFHQNLSAEARPYLRKALDLFLPEEIEYRNTTRYYLGFIDITDNDLTAAEKRFESIVREGQGKAKAPGLFGLAHLLYARKAYPQLQETVSKILENDPDFFDKETLTFFLCRTYVELRQWELLEKFLPKFVDEYPHGRYKSTYPAFVKALRYRQPPPPKDDGTGGKLLN
ncbi:MAG TPA: tetratricopeptide repeat protein [Calditrichia bacterium]|nr:tetratricopeptide repeat protein [Calditrichia bacterium]